MQFQEIRLKLIVTSNGYVRQLAYDYMYIRVLVHVYMQNFTSDRLYSKTLLLQFPISFLMEEIKVAICSAVTMHQAEKMLLLQDIISIICSG